MSELFSDVISLKIERCLVLDLPAGINFVFHKNKVNNATKRVPALIPLALLVGTVFVLITIHCCWETN